MAGRMKALIEEKLTAALGPDYLDVIDDSASHKGHASAPEGGESHFNVEIVSSQFEGQNRLARQRLVMAALADELKGPIHALSIKARAPGEG